MGIFFIIPFAKAATIFYFKTLLPAIVCLFIGITLLVTCFKLGLNAGLTVIATIISVITALYFINGKEIFTKVITIFKKLFSLSSKVEEPEIPAD